MKRTLRTLRIVALLTVAVPLLLAQPGQIPGPIDPPSRALPPRNLLGLTPPTNLRTHAEVVARGQEQFHDRTRVADPLWSAACGAPSRDSRNFWRKL
jgi:hypothetical protein